MAIGAITNNPADKNMNNLQGGQAQKASQSPAKLRGGDAFMEMLNQQQLAGQAQNKAMLDAWTKAQQRRPMIRRTMGGEVIDQTPVKQPEGMDFFKQNNPFTEESLQRQHNINAQNKYQSQLGAWEGGQAVDQLKKQQVESGVRNPDGSTNFMSNIPSKTIGGQKFVFDQKGQVVGMTGDSGAGGKLASGEIATPEGRAQNRQGMENAFLSAMSKPSVSTPEGGKPFDSAAFAKSQGRTPSGQQGPNPMPERTIKKSYQPPTPKGYQLPGAPPVPTASQPYQGQRFDIPNQAVQASSPKPSTPAATPAPLTPQTGYQGRRFDIPTQATGAPDQSMGKFWDWLSGAVTPVAAGVGASLSDGFNTILGGITPDPTTQQMFENLPSPSMPNMPWQNQRVVDPNNPNQYQQLPNWWDSLMAPPKGPVQPNWWDKLTSPQTPTAA